MNLLTLNIETAKPITAATVLDYSLPLVPDGQSLCAQTESQILNEQLSERLNDEIRNFTNAHASLKCLTDKINSFYDTMFAEHSKHIARLSVAVASKILAQKIDSGQYDIENIIDSELKKLPEKSGITVFLNPSDLSALEEAMKCSQRTGFENIDFASDPNIRPAHLRIETQKGSVSSIIESKLKRIEAALSSAG